MQTGPITAVRPIVVDGQQPQSGLLRIPVATELDVGRLPLIERLSSVPKYTFSPTSMDDEYEIGDSATNLPFTRASLVKSSSTRCEAKSPEPYSPPAK